MKLSPTPVQPPDLLDGALKILGPDLRAADIDLVVKSHDSIKSLNVDWILCDTLRVVQISLNVGYLDSRLGRNLLTSVVAVKCHKVYPA